MGRTLFTMCWLCSCIGISSAGDWPQWRGPNRDAVVSDFTAPKMWPKSLTKKWKTTIGQGVATPALVGDKLYTFGYSDGQEIIRCLNAASGEEIWKEAYTAKPASGPARGFPAARSSPAVQDNKLVTLGVQGTLSCLDATTGKVIWRKENTGGTPGFSTSCSPLLIEGLCVVQIGGERGGSVAAFQLSDGKEKWKWASDGTKYASPAVLTVGDLQAVIVETAGTVSAISLMEGQLLWSTDFSTRYNAVAPITDGSTIYYSGSNQPLKAVAFERQDKKLVSKELWSNRDGSVIYNSPIIRDGLVFGVSERNELFCMDAKTGQTRWTSRLPAGASGGRGRGGYGSIVSAGPVLFALSPAAQLVVFKPDRESYQEIASYKVAEGNTYAYPVVTSKGVYIRDGDSVTFWTFE